MLEKRAKEAMSRIIGNLKIKKNRNNCRGFSLLEILVATVLGLLLFAIVLQNYLGAKNIYRAQTELAYSAENVRFADFVLWQNIMHAGFAGCRKISELNLNNHTTRYFKEFDAIRGYDSSNVPSYLHGKVVKGTDVVVIVRASSDVTRVARNVGIGATSIKVMQNPATEGNKFLLISDCKNADLFEADNYRGRTIHFKNALGNAYDIKSAEVGRFEELAFFISNTKRTDEKNKPIYGLYFSTNRGDKRELVPGISDMRIQYGIDTKNLGVVNKYLSANEIGDARLWGKVLIVKITVKMQGQTLGLNQRTFYIKLRERG